MMDFNIFDEMLILNRISLKGLFHLLCIIGTAAIGIDCLLKYIKNEDVSRSDYQNFIGIAKTTFIHPCPFA